MTSGHLIADRDLSLLSNIDAHCLVHSWRQFISVISSKYLCIYDNTVLSVRHFKRCIPYFPRLLAEDRAKQPLLCGQFGLSLWSYLSYQDIAGAYLCANTNDSSLIQVLKGIIAHSRNIAGNLFWSQLGITGFCLIFLDMHGSIDIFLHQSLA